MPYFKEWKAFSHEVVKPNRLIAFLYRLLVQISRLTFSIKVMEHGEARVERSFALIESSIPESSQIIKEENEYENLLVDMIDEDRINYIGSMVLGLNDALVELTGALAGFTLALQNTRQNCLVVSNVYHV